MDRIFEFKLKHKIKNNDVKRSGRPKGIRLSPLKIKPSKNPRTGNPLPLILIHEDRTPHPLKILLPQPLTLKINKSFETLTST